MQNNRKLIRNNYLIICRFSVSLLEFCVACVLNHIRVVLPSLEEVQEEEELISEAGQLM